MSKLYKKGKKAKSSISFLLIFAIPKQTANKLVIKAIILSKNEFHKI